mmetsp:Transcript_6268/g.9055  ORF Transcript_6268/g.9055 Transcript_6268/m.9055 type:complete len:288 (-) Transcript_6268:293-1156(-)|eukprot:CAMPEP_0194033260 /NCGR_PEP_ID=MMETSP0009_2-20130614/6018_1 /TAXON_ID=210454 /ORGANISM="Grammatophora oceanica, Strain CCMP 410" /LENGTH=287 /DNA_ID=CAMNT_0038673925 /DNA_START=153 /DNA_END=1016 /DNA_ORIENTATION=-
MIPEMVIFPTKVRGSSNGFSRHQVDDDGLGLLVRPGTMNGSEDEHDLSASKPTLPGSEHSRSTSRGRSSSTPSCQLSSSHHSSRRGSHNMYQMTAPPLTPRRRRTTTSLSTTTRAHSVSPTTIKPMRRSMPPIPSDSASTLIMEESYSSLYDSDRPPQQGLGQFLQRSSHRFVGEEDDDAGSHAPSVPGVVLPMGVGCSSSVAPTVVSMDYSQPESMSTASTTTGQMNSNVEAIKPLPPPPLLEDVEDDMSEAPSASATPATTNARRKVFCRRGDKIGSYYSKPSSR